MQIVLDTQKPPRAPVSPAPPVPVSRKGTRNAGRYSLLATLCILAAAVFYAAAVRDGHDWGGDYAQYILHARALLQGQPYAPPPGFVLNPYLSWAPPAYPPLLPVGIAAVLSVFGLNFIAIKLLGVVIFTLGLLAYRRFARLDLPPPAALGALLLLAFSPYLLKFSNKILSDIPYLSISLFAILAAEKFFRQETARKNDLLLLLCLVLSTCMRTVGLALLLSVPLYALLFRRDRFFRAAFISAAAFAVISAISWSMIGFYLDQAGPRPARLLLWFIGNLRSFPVQFTRYLSLYPDLNSILHNLVNVPLAAIYAAFTVVGAISLFRRRGIRHWDVYAAVYLGAVLVYSLLKSRYLIPLVPLLSIYTFQGIRVAAVSLRTRLTSRTRRRPLFRRLMRYRFLYPALICAPLFLAYWTVYTFRPTTPDANILKQPDLQELIEAVQDPALDIRAVIFHHPRVLTLFTGVPATTCFNAAKYWQQDVVWDLPKLLGLSAQSRISHVIMDREQSATWQALHPVLTAHPRHFERVYSNSGYDIYRILHN